MNVQKTLLTKMAKNLGLIGLVASAINSWWIITQWYAVSSISTEKIAWIVLSLSWLLFLPLLFAPFVFLASLSGLIFKKSRKVSVILVTFSLLFFITGLISMKISGGIRHDAFKKLANSSSALVGAIENYETQHGTAPEKLEQLVPDFLPSVPKTGIGAYPDYNYSKCVVMDQNEKGCFGNPWMIQISTSPGGINFDSFIYLPNKNYPEKGYGGTLERIENWAYVHE